MRLHVKCVKAIIKFVFAEGNVSSLIACDYCHSVALQAQTESWNEEVTP